MVNEAVTAARIMSVRFDQSPASNVPSFDESTMRFTKENFDASDPTKRPKGWFEIRHKRVILKEQADRNKGIDEDIIAEMRPNRELEEEALMLTEVSSTGRLAGANSKHDAVTVIITKANFSSTDSTKRPPGWAELRLKRVMLKEHIDRIAGIDEENILDMRSDREIQVMAIQNLVYFLCLYDMSNLYLTE
jgi:hypothetical protein